MCHHIQLYSLDLYNSSCVLCISKGTIDLKQQRVINKARPYFATQTKQSILFFKNANDKRNMFCIFHTNELQALWVLRVTQLKNKYSYTAETCTNIQRGINFQDWADLLKQLIYFILDNHTGFAVITLRISETHCLSLGFQYIYVINTERL